MLKAILLMSCLVGLAPSAQADGVSRQVPTDLIPVPVKVEKPSVVEKVDQRCDWVSGETNVKYSSGVNYVDSGFFYSGGYCSPGFFLPGTNFISQPSTIETSGMSEVCN